MKQHETLQTPKEYDRFQGQDHATRGTDDRWEFSEQVDIDNIESQENFITQQEIENGIEDYQSSVFNIPTMRETSVHDEIDVDIPETELVYSTDINHLPEQQAKEIEDWKEVYETDISKEVLPMISKAVGKRREAAKATLDEELLADEYGDDFPDGMHTTDRP